ncbi:MAG: hypothetical protein Q9186_005397 [Xanthomendoza sp. 1 TL-2023]
MSHPSNPPPPRTYLSGGQVLQNSTPSPQQNNPPSTSATDTSDVPAALLYHDGVLVAEAVVAEAVVGDQEDQEEMEGRLDAWMMLEGLNVGVVGEVFFLGIYMRWEGEGKEEGKEEGEEEGGEFDREANLG